VRWVLSFHALPEDLVSRRDEIRLEEVAEPLRLYELRDPLPRAFFVPTLEGPLGAGRGTVSYEPVNPTPSSSGCPRLRDSSDSGRLSPGLDS